MTEGKCQALSGTFSLSIYMALITIACESLQNNKSSDKTISLPSFHGEVNTSTVRIVVCMNETYGGREATVKK